MGLHVGLVDPFGREGARYPHRGTRKGGLDVTALVPVLADDVRRQLLRDAWTVRPTADGGVRRCGGFFVGVADRGVRRSHLAGVLAGIVLVRPGKRGIHGHGPGGIDRRIDRGVVHDHGIDAVLGRRLALGDDHGHRLSREDRLARREGLVHPHVLPALDRQIGCGEDGDHAGHLRCRRRVDPVDRGVRVRAEDQARVQQPGQRDRNVRREARRPDDFLARIEARPGGAHGRGSRDVVSSGRGHLASSG